MRIIIDADACPSIDLIVECAKRYQIEVLIFKDTSHILENDYAKVYTVSKSYQGVDMAIINEVKKNDIIITQDFGLAMLILSKNAKAIHTKGFLYDNDSISILLEQRHESSKLRKMGVHTKGPKKRTEEDNNKLITNLEKIIIENLL